MKAKTDEKGVIVANIEGQNPVSASELLNILDIIAGVMFLRLKSKSEYGKARLSETIDELWKRVFVLKEKNIYRFVKQDFFIKYISLKLNVYL